MNMSWGEIQQAMAESLECPLCAVLVVDRYKHQQWHLMHTYSGTPAFWQAKADELQRWVDESPHRTESRMSAPGQAFLVSTGEYSNYQVVAVCLDRAEAESLAAWLGNTGGYGTGAHEVEEADLGDGWQNLAHYDELVLSAYIYEDGNVKYVENNDRGLGNKGEACKAEIDVTHYHFQCVHVCVRGTDHERVRKVLTEQAAQAKADYPILVERERLRRAEQDAKYEQWKLDNPQGFLTSESSQSYYSGPEPK